MDKNQKTLLDAGVVLRMFKETDGYTVSAHDNKTPLIEEKTATNVDPDEAVNAMLQIATDAGWLSSAGPSTEEIAAKFAAQAGALSAANSRIDALSQERDAKEAELTELRKQLAAT